MDSPPLDKHIALISEEVQNLVSETSEKYVPQPSKSQILADLLVGLKRFRESVRWKWHWKEQKQIQLEIEGKLSNLVNVENEMERMLETKKLKAALEGLGTKLRARHKPQTTAPIASNEVESFLLEEVQRMLLAMADEEDERKETNKSKEIKKL